MEASERGRTGEVRMNKRGVTTGACGPTQQPRAWGGEEA